MKYMRQLVVILIIVMLLTGLALIAVKGLDLLGYEGQLINHYNTPPSEMTEIKGEATVGQTFTAPLDGLQRIDVVLRNYGRQNTQEVTFFLKQSPDSPTVIYQETFKASTVRDNQRRTFEFPPIPDSANKTFFFYFASPASTSGDAITVGGGEGYLYGQGEAYLGPMPIPRAALAFRTYYGLSPGQKLSILGQRLGEDKPSIWSDVRFYILLAALYGLILLRIFVEMIRLALDGDEH